MRYCLRCLNPNTRPNGTFGPDGVCGPCKFDNAPDDSEFSTRFEELVEIVSNKVALGRNPRWDCIVGVSGGKDSTRQALWVRERLELRPLLVTIAYPPRQMSHMGAQNLSNLSELGFDVHFLGPAPLLSRKLVREAFFRFGNFAKPTEMALFAGVPRLAIEKRIPLILWGENPALQVGDSAMLGANMWDGNNMINGNTLAGGDLGWFTEVADENKHLRPYQFPTQHELTKSGVQTIFLGPAWSDWSAEMNSATSLAHGLISRPLDGPITDDPYGTSMLDECFMTVHFLLKYFKLGFGRATDIASALIRRGEITRQEGIALVERHDGQCPEADIDLFCSYISATAEEFWLTIRRFADERLFDISGDRPVPRFMVGRGIGA